MRLCLTLAVLAGHMSATTTLADTRLPIYDVDRSCAAWTSGEAFGLADICVEMEQNLYDGLKVVWRDAPEYAKAYCVAREKAAMGSNDDGAPMPHLRYEALSKCLSFDGRSRIPVPATERFKP